MFHPMKPETIKRRAVARRQEVAQNRAAHIQRLRDIVTSGRDTAGTYAELLAEAEARQETTLVKLGA